MGEYNGCLNLHEPLEMQVIEDEERSKEENGERRIIPLLPLFLTSKPVCLFLPKLGINNHIYLLLFHPTVSTGEDPRTHLKGLHDAGVMTLSLKSPPR